MAEKPKSEKEKQAPSAKQEEKVLVIPLRREARRSAKNMRKNRSVRAIRAFLARHMRTDVSNVSISQQLNEALWKGGLHNNLASIKVKVKTEDGNVLASMLDEKERGKKQKGKVGLRQRLARRKEAAKEEKPAEIKEKPASEKKPELKKEGAKAPSSEKPKPAKEPAPEEAAAFGPEGQ